MCGIDIRFFFLTNGLLGIPTALFFTLVVPFFKDPLRIVAAAAGGGLFLLVLFFLWSAAFTDPGFIPRGDVPEPQREEDYFRPNGEKYCKTCRLWRPPRAKHCRYCGACVLKLDHHCPWIGTCVGERNYKYFFGFLSSVTIYCALVFAFTIMHLVEESVSTATDNGRDKTDWMSYFDKALYRYPVSLVLAFFCAFVFLSLCSLALYHAHLIAIAQTTNENIKRTYNDKKNPFHKGSCRNYAKLCCGTPVRSRILRKRPKLSAESQSSSLGGSESDNPDSKNHQHGSSQGHNRRTTPQGFDSFEQSPGRDWGGSAGGPKKAQFERGRLGPKRDQLKKQDSDFHVLL